MRGARLVPPVVLLLLVCAGTASSRFFDSRTMQITRFLMNYTNMTSEVDVKSIKRTVRAEQASEHFTYANHKEIVEANGHPYCGGILRDNWMCVGDIYADTLKRTKPLNVTRFGMQNFFGPTLILASGNSLTAQVLYTWVCYSNARVFSNVKCENDSCRPRTNSIIAVSKKTILILLDNDEERCTDAYFDALLLALRARNWCPEFIIEGHQNSWLPLMPNHPSEINRYTSHMTHCPQAKFLTQYPHHSGSGCSAEFRNCDPAFPGVYHQCTPGPIVRSVERFVANLQYERLFVLNDPEMYFTYSVHYKYFEDRDQVWEGLSA